MAVNELQKTISALAFETLAQLDGYEVSIKECCARWPDFAAYSDACKRLEQIRLCSGSVARLSVPVVALVIAHAELIFRLSDNQPPVDCRAQLLASVSALRRRLLELIRSG